MILENPVHDRLRLKCEGAADITIYDAYGRQVAWHSAMHGE